MSDEIEGAIEGVAVGLMLGIERVGALDGGGEDSALGSIDEGDPAIARFGSGLGVIDTLKTGFDFHGRPRKPVD